MKKKKGEKLIVKALKEITTDSYEEVMTKLKKELKKDKKKFIITANPETLMLVENDEVIKSMMFNKNILKVPDGIAVVKACQKHKMKIKERITGVEIAEHLLKIANKNKYKVYLFGATEEVIDKLETKIKENYPFAKIIALEPEQLPIITKGIINGKHRIEGIGDDFIPSIVDMNIIDKIITINDEDAINMSRILARKFGVGIGISSGANLLASIITANDNDNVVTVFPDDLKKYLSTDLSKNINNDKNLISNQIEIISIKNV